MSSAQTHEPRRPRVRTLLCHRDVPLLLHTWPTLVVCSREPVDTVVHDDGSLTADDAGCIQSAIPRCRILWRHEADEQMADVLHRYPHARAFRAASVWGLKLLDVVLAEPGDCFYVDADIRFFRSFEGLFSSSAIAGGPVFLRDLVWTAYSIRPWHLLGPRRLRVSTAINTGLTLIARRDFDLAFVDWFLAQADWRVIPAWTEPTCWAALAARQGGWTLEPAQLPNLYPGTRIAGDAIGAHFLSAFRSRFQHELERAVNERAPACPIRLRKLGTLRAVELGLNQLKRKFSNEWERLTR